MALSKFSLKGVHLLYLMITTFHLQQKHLMFLLNTLNSVNEQLLLV